jgi:tRNA A37 threonylcarbamoyladenosine dehydratase
LLKRDSVQIARPGEHVVSPGSCSFGVECVVWNEPVVYPKEYGSVGDDPAPDPDLRLDCDTGFGTASFVTGTFGLVATSRIMQRIVEARDERNSKPEARNPKEIRSPRSE